MQNQLNRIAVIRVNAALTSGRVVTRITDGRFAVPTTIDDLGRRLYAVNARFGSPPATTDYQVIQVRKPNGSLSTDGRAPVGVRPSDHPALCRPARQLVAARELQLA